MVGGGQPVEMGWLAAFLCPEPDAFLTAETVRLDGGYGKSVFQGRVPDGRNSGWHDTISQIR